MKVKSQGFSELDISGRETCFFIYTDIAPAGQQLLGHGVLPRGLGAAHTGGHRVL